MSLLLAGGSILTLVIQPQSSQVLITPGCHGHRPVDATIEEETDMENQQLMAMETAIAADANERCV